VWEALDLELNDTGPTNDFHTGTGGAWVALNIARRANANQGGTALTPDGTFGQNWGIDIVNVASGNATFLALQNGIEINMACTGNPTGDDVQTASFTGSISGQTLTITAISSGTPGPNMLINGTGVSPAVIVAQLTGTTGGVGTYSINGHAQTAASTALTGSNPTASVLRRAGIQISQSQGHSRRGTMWDNAFLLSAGLGAAPWRNGITVGSVLASQSPLTSDSKVFTYELAQDLTGSANIGIEMNDITFTTASIQLPGFRVDPIGATRIGTTYLTPSATGLAVDTKGSTTTGTPTISNAGSGYPTSGVGANVIADDAYGGVYTLQTSTTSDPVPGIIKAIEAVIRRPIYNGLTPPATLAVTGRAPSLGTGCVLGVTWNTAATTLALQPSGGNISSAPLTNAANDAAAAAAGVPLNGWYRNGSVMMQRVA
jgi:hypothetical protein